VLPAALPQRNTDTAPPEVIRAFFARYGDVKKYREAEARRFVSKLRISATPASGVLSADPEHRSIDDSWRSLHSYLAQICAGGFVHWGR